jgi:hypothetical protein
LAGGTGSIHLEGQLKSGKLVLEIQDFIQEFDRTVIVHGIFSDTSSSKKFYAAMFSHRHDRTVFAILRDDDHSTTLVFSNSDDSAMGRLLLWHDTAAAESFRINKAKFLDKETIVDEAAKPIDFAAKRKPPDFTAKELEAVFGDDPALLKFMRGKRSHHNPPPDKLAEEWICHILSLLPGSPFTIIWAAD